MQDHAEEVYGSSLDRLRVEEAMGEVCDPLFKGSTVREGEEVGFGIHNDIREVLDDEL